jgi:hypothetical protein
MGRMRQVKRMLRVGFRRELCIDTLTFSHPKFHNIHKCHIKKNYPDERVQLIYSNLTSQRIEHTFIRNIIW